MLVGEAIRDPSDQAAKGESPRGLTADEVLRRRAEHGQNVLPATKGRSVWSILLAQLASPLVYIILAAALISLLAGETGDFVLIMVVVVADVILGFVQEYQADRAYVSLRGLLKPTATVIRDGNRQEVEVAELVPGDLVVLGAGDRVPADGIVIESTKLAADESILTGESEPVAKWPMPGQDAVYMGTTAVTGRAFVRVTRTGAGTELGKIASSLEENPREETPLQVRLKAFSATLTRILIGLTAIILLSGIASGRAFLEMLRVSIVLAVAAVPEGLLIAVTVIQVLGMRRILKWQGLVKRLSAVETLGSVTMICTDKTGTLTEGRMRVTRAELADRDRALETVVLCNDLEGPVDVALWEYAETQLSEDPQALVDGSERSTEELFSSETKYMITRSQSDAHIYDYLYDYPKGAPEIVLGMCEMESAERERILARVDEWAGEGLRLLGLAYRPERPLEDHSGYTWVGLLGREDPIREGVKESIAVARRAGIRVSMITGDYRKTAERIARGLGLSTGDSCGDTGGGTGDGQTLDGEALAALDDEALQEEVGRTAVFARIRPRDKLRIVEAMQARGEIAAMVGDGVNDAPALQQANIGVVVGTATDVAKETADLILLDSNFRTIVAAIEEGRVVFENIRKVVAYTLSNSFAEILTIFAAMLLGWPQPLLVAQILWLNLICDGPTDITLGFEPKEPGIMEETPKSANEPILTPLGLWLIGIISVTSATAALLLYGHALGTPGGVALGRSYVFATLAVNSMVYVFAYRSLRRPMLQSGSPLENKPLLLSAIGGLGLAFVAFLVPPLREALQLLPRSLAEWGLIFAVALSQLMIVEIAKQIGEWRRRASAVRGIG